MREMDDRVQADAARRYASLRGRFQFVCVSALVLGPLWIAILAAFGERLGRAVLAVLVPMFFAYVVAFAVTYMMLLGFRCPRCDQQFIVAMGKGSCPTDCCKHCGLRLR